ncbi:MAG TPA: hypothetical protein VJS68_02970, partial [Thermoplasmata archaeon]|nr:hypothetical protein [Thermoplasmata archaeon]
MAAAPMGITEGVMLLGSSAVALVLGFGYASYTDLRTREVSDRLWVGLALVGFVVGLIPLLGEGPIPLLLWVLAGVLVLEHLIPWDVPLERVRSWLPGAVELSFYALTVVVIAAAAARYGFAPLPQVIAPDKVPLTVLAVVVGVFLARGLFEAGVLYGGADAKALMVAGLVLPL